MTPWPLVATGADLACLATCRWPVRPSPARGWQCTAPFGHDDEHRLELGGRVVARSAGYEDPP